MSRRFTLNREVVPLFAACGTWWAICLDEKPFFIMQGTRMHAEHVVAQLNAMCVE